MTAKTEKSIKERIGELIKSKKISVLQLAEQTGINSARIYKWYKENTNPKTDDAKILEKWLSSLEKGINNNNQAMEINQQVSRTIEAQMPNEKSMEIIKGLMESNKVLSESNKTLADAHYLLAKTNSDLAEMAKKATESEPQEIPAAVQSKLVQLLGYIAEVGSGKRWKSIDEAVAALHSEFYASKGQDNPAKAYTQNG
jgi:transcriptional regulator with XRE-family HTH domain